MFCCSLCSPLCAQQRKFIIFRLLFRLIAITRDELREKYCDALTIGSAEAVKIGIDRTIVGVDEFEAR